MKRLLFVTALVACGSKSPAPTVPAPAPAPAPAPSPAPSPAPAPTPAPPATPTMNPFFEVSSLPYHLPPFDKIKDADYMPAFEKGMEDQRKEIDAIAKSGDAPTFENTIVAMEKTGRLLTRVQKVFFNLNQSNGDEAMQKIEAEITPRLSAHNDSILLDSDLFKRVETVYAQKGKLGLDAESTQLLERYHKMFVRAGAKLADKDKARLKELNTQISALQTAFRQRVLAATKEGAVVVEDVKQLDGFTPEQISAAAEAAKARGMGGKWLITLQNTTQQPALEQLTNRELRQRIFEASANRAQSGASDTRETVTKLLTLRAEKAKL
ncbi:MAG: dipeptidyl carboxypeptidase II, partial [Deltaproteobacteria bacterium]|nr:dipeptidyl carboxypeptidase II [Deltaproteobacteria bacterium]